MWRSEGGGGRKYDFPSSGGGYRRRCRPSARLLHHSWNVEGYLGKSSRYLISAAGLVGLVAQLHLSGTRVFFFHFFVFRKADTFAAVHNFSLFHFFFHFCVSIQFQTRDHEGEFRTSVIHKITNFNRNR